MRTRARQGELRFRSRGGRRKGAGRKSADGRRRVSHHGRPAHEPRHPVHVTLRAADGLPSLRNAPVFPAVRRALAAASTGAFRVVHWSVQADHLHLLVEADRPAALARGMQGLAIRTAKAVNRALARRGRVFGDRYHARALPTPREVRNALVYVLNNLKKHVPGARGPDPRSSSAWFSGWSVPPTPREGAAPVAAARTWLLRVGWLRHGRIAIGETPRAAPPRRGDDPRRSRVPG